MSDRKHNTFVYYTDFVMYPIIAISLAIFGLFYAPDGRWTSLSIAVTAGTALWTLVEYFLHRAVLHHMPYVRGLHDRHHMAPKELIDSPLWLGLSFTFGGILAPACLILGLAHGACFTAGMILGYVAYAVMHHGLHHWRIPHGSYLYRAKRRHALHHASNDKGNYGVSSPLWDYVFGTDLPDPAPAKIKRKQT